MLLKNKQSGSKLQNERKRLVDESFVALSPDCPRAVDVQQKNTCLLVERNVNVFREYVYFPNTSQMRGHASHASEQYEIRRS